MFTRIIVDPSVTGMNVQQELFSTVQRVLREMVKNKEACDASFDMRYMPINGASPMIGYAVPALISGMARLWADNIDDLTEEMIELFVSDNSEFLTENRHIDVLIDNFSGEICLRLSEVVQDKKQIETLCDKMFNPWYFDISKSEMTLQEGWTAVPFERTTKTLENNYYM